MPRSGDSAFCCQLRLGKKERLSYIPLSLCTLFLAGMVNTLLRGAALRSCIILSPHLSARPIEKRWWWWWWWSSSSGFYIPVGLFSTFSSHFLSGSLFSLPSFCLLASTRCPHCSAPFKQSLVPPPVGLFLFHLSKGKERKKKRKEGRARRRKFRIQNFFGIGLDLRLCL